MAVNSDNTLVAIINHKGLFYRLFDYIEANKGGSELPATLYNQLLRQTLLSKTRPEARKLAETLDLENLERNGLLIYFDKRASTFLLQPFVVDMLRQLDKRRLKELSDSDLQGMRSQLNDLLSLISANGFNWYQDNADYKEAIAYIYETLRVISSRIQQNIESLHGQSTHLAEIVDSKEHGRLSRAEQLRNALGRILQITERHIDPTLSFLDPHKQWHGEGKLAPMAILGEILQRFEQRGRHEEYNQLNRIYLSLLSQAERISHIRKSLSSYLNLFEEQRKIYNRIEARFNALYEKVTALQDGRLSGLKLKPNDAHFQALACIHGIKDHRAAYNANIDWPTIGGRALLDETLRTQLKHYHNAAVNNAREATEDAQAEQQRIARIRINQIKEVSQNIVLEDNKDIYQQIHDVLIKTITDYNLNDLLDAIAFTPGANHAIKLPIKHCIEHNGTQLRYFERQLEASELPREAV